VPVPVILRPIEAGEGEQTMSNIGRRRATALKQDAETYTRRRREVIEAAAQLFKKNGYAHTSLNDVAEALESDRATIYYYVASKKELLHEVVRDVVEATAKEALEIRRRKDPAPVKLKELILALMRAYAKNFPYQYVYIQEGIAVNSHGDAHLFKLGQQYERCLVDIIAEGLADGSFASASDAKIIAYGILGSLNWTHRWFNPAGRLTSDQVAETFADLFLRGLEPREKTARAKRAQNA
jgi:TetR/AcrR family transcriptional regulator, cholesterol catabolism regulator